MMDLEGWSACLRVLSDATRVRLLALLEREELTVAELAAITQLAQPRVSTHLAKLKEPAWCAIAAPACRPITASPKTTSTRAAGAVESISAGSDDPLLRQDAERVPAVLAMRAADQNWADRGRRHGTPLLARPHLGSAGARRAATARTRRRARHRLGRRRAGRTAGAAAPLRLHRLPASAWSRRRSERLRRSPTWKCAKATCMHWPSRTPVSIWCC
jgi:DNA-binding transcriptional ArsR family regulator